MDISSIKEHTASPEELESYITKRLGEYARLELSKSNICDDNTLRCVRQKLLLSVQDLNLKYNLNLPKDLCDKYVNIAMDRVTKSTAEKNTDTQQGKHRFGKSSNGSGSTLQYELGADGNMHVLM